MTGGARRRVERSAGFAAVAFAALLTAAGAPAHTRSQSFSSWLVDGARASVSVRIPLLELTRIPGAELEDRSLEAWLGPYVAERLILRAAGQLCEVSQGPWVLHPAADRVRVEWGLECPGDRELEIETGLLLDLASSHLHFAKLRLGAAPPMERVLSERARRWTFAPADADSGSSPAGARFADYLRLGVEHIASGADHLVFLLALLLLAGTLRELAFVVTGFTVGHSLTLALAVLGVLQPQARAVEATIGLSIAIVAAENAALLARRTRAVGAACAALLLLLAAASAAGVGAVSGTTLIGVALFVLCYFWLLERVPRPVRLRGAVALFFGLVHGFGFGGVLQGIGLPAGRVVHGLLGFNLGVELGQLAAVALAWPMLRWLARARDGRAAGLVTELASAAICGLGVFWFVARTFG